MPTVIVKTFNFEPQLSSAEKDNYHGNRNIDESKKKKPKTKFKNDKNTEYIQVYVSNTKKVEKIPLEEYIKGVVSAEMPARFHIEALKAQAVAARTYAISRNEKHNSGHPDHKKAPICSSTHCQAYLSLEELEEIHGKKWVKDYWGKIEEAVESTKNIVINFDGEIIEPLYHSTSGGKTEDAIHVFATDSPYLKSVDSPHEEEAPKYKESMTFTVDEFIKTINKKYKDVKLKKDDFFEKIKLVEKSPSGRVKTLAIDNTMISGSDMRKLFELNSTNFTITYDKKVDLIEIETQGYGHGVGMSQWGANGMAKEGKTYEEILKHYYSGVDIGKM